VRQQQQQQQHRTCSSGSTYLVFTLLARAVVMKSTVVKLAAAVKWQLWQRLLLLLEHTMYAMCYVDLYLITVWRRNCSWQQLQMPQHILSQHSTAPKCACSHAHSHPLHLSILLLLLLLLLLAATQLPQRATSLSTAWPRNAKR
jgi:hypothetical protein